MAESLEDLSSDFTSKQLLLHPGEVQHNPIKALGVQLDGEHLSSSIAPDRLHRVRQGLRCILRRGRCTGRVLEILVGHCTYCGLMNRCLLSVFHNVYKFIKSNYWTATPLWQSVAAELRAFAGLMPLLHAEWRRPWNPVVSVSDASEEGYGVCGALFNSQAVASIGRVCERERFRRVGTHSARESALTSAGFVRSEVTGQWLDGALEDAEYLRASGWDLNAQFPEVPKSMMDPANWTTVRQGPWKRKEHIVHLEALALVKSFEFIAQDLSTGNSRQLLLVDSMSAALAFDRCRSKNFKMLRRIRRFCSFALARNISFSVRWVPSELNPADDPSRDQSKFVGVCPSSFLSLVHPAPVHGAQTCISAVAASDRSQSKAEKPGARGRRSYADKVEQADKDVENPRLGCSADEVAYVPEPSFGCPWQLPHADQAQCQDGSRIRRFQQLFRTSEGQHSDKAVATSEQGSPAKVPRRDVQFSLSGADPLGEEGHWGQSCEVLQPGVCESPEVCCLQADVYGSSSLGPSAEQLLQPSFSPRVPWTPWRQDHGGGDASSSRVWSSGFLEAPSCLALPQGVASPSPWGVKACLSPCSMGSHLLRDAEERSTADGLVHNDRSVLLQPPWRAAEVSGLRPGEAFPYNHRTLGFAAESGRETREIQGGRVRRQCPSRFPLPETMGSSLDEAVDQSSQRAAVVELRLWPLLPGLPADHGVHEPRHDAIPDAPQRSLHRSVKKRQIVGGGAEKRPLEKPQERGQVREECEACSKFPSSTQSPATPLPGRRKTTRGCDVGHGAASSAALAPKGLKGQYVADFFAGVGGVAKACRRLGFAAKEWEISRGSQFDLTSRGVQKKIKKDINARLVIAAMLAPPCGTFSVARDRTTVIRSKDFPWGLPADLLSPKDYVKVQTGNSCFQAALRIIHWLDQHRIPWILENPATSKCWYLPPLQKLEQSPHVVCVLTDFCQYGCAWRKRTKLMCGNLDSQDVHRLQRLCTGRGLCSRTSKRHFQLTGSNRQGIPWTRVAQPYPQGLNKDLAFSLTSPSHYNPPLW